MRVLFALLASVILSAAESSALEIRIKEVRTANETVQASLELREVVPERFKRALETNGTLHLRIQTELWIVRPVWDQLVYPAVVRMIQMTSGSPVTDPLPIQVDLGKKDRIDSASRYYVHVIATLGTLAQRDADEVGDAVFGRDADSSSLGALGRAVFRTASKIGDYMQSVSAEVRGKRVPGRDLLKP